MGKPKHLINTQYCLLCFAAFNGDTLRQFAHYKGHSQELKKALHPAVYQEVQINEQALERIFDAKVVERAVLDSEFLPVDISHQRMDCAKGINYLKETGVAEIAEMFTKAPPVVCGLPSPSEREGLSLGWTKNGGAVMTYLLADLQDGSVALGKFMEVARPKPGVLNRPPVTVLWDAEKKRVGVGFMAEGATTYKLLKTQYGLGKQFFFLATQEAVLKLVSLPAECVHLY